MSTPNERYDAALRALDATDDDTYKARWAEFREARAAKMRSDWERLAAAYFAEARARITAELKEDR